LANFEFDHPEGGQIVRHTFKIKVWELAISDRVARWRLA